MNEKLNHHGSILDKIVKYALEHNNRLPVGNESDSNIRSLGTWLCHMKTAKKANTLDEGLKDAIY